MEDNLLPQSIGVNSLPPIRLTDEQENLCKRLDEWHTSDGLQIRPSDMFRGAIFAVRDECNNNPDRIAQSANSLREILYPFISRQVKKITNKKEKAFGAYGSVTVDQNFYLLNIEPLWKKLNDLAHHGVNPNDQNFNFSAFKLSDFKKTVAEFEKNMNVALTRQLDVHLQLDEILANSPQ